MDKVKLFFLILTLTPEFIYGSSRVVFNYDYEHCKGDITCGNTTSFVAFLNNQDCFSNEPVFCYSGRIDESIFREPSFGSSMRYELRIDDQKVVKGKRSETDTLSHSPETRYGPTDVFTYYFSLYLPSTWVVPEKPSCKLNSGRSPIDCTTDYSKEADIVFQWHRIPDSCLGSRESRLPNMTLQVKGSRLVLRHNNEVDQSGQITITEDLNLGKWTDFKIQVRWHYLNTGWIKVWYKTDSDDSFSVQPHYSYAGPTMFNDLNKGYLKWGIYRPSWNNCSDSSCANHPIQSRALFIDKVLVTKETQ